MSVSRNNENDTQHLQKSTVQYITVFKDAYGIFTVQYRKVKREYSLTATISADIAVNFRDPESCTQEYLHTCDAHM